jgi:hypothetical protein
MEEVSVRSGEVTHKHREETGTSNQGVGTNPAGVNLVAYTRGAWKGSSVNQDEIDGLYRSSGIPEQVFCRIPGQAKSLSLPPILSAA